MSTQARAPLLLFSGAHGDAEFYYASRFEVENAIYARFATGDDVLVVGTLEVERARKEAMVARVVDWVDLGWTERVDRLASWSEVALRLLAERGATAVVTSPRLFAAIYRALTE